MTPSAIGLERLLAASSPANTNGVSTQDLIANDPPSPAAVQALIDKVNELIDA